MKPHTVVRTLCQIEEEIAVGYLCRVQVSVTDLYYLRSALDWPGT